MHQVVPVAQPLQAWQGQQLGQQATDTHQRAPGTYRQYLAEATLTVAIHTVDVVTTVLLIIQYYQMKVDKPAAGMFIIYCLEAVHLILYDWLNWGRLAYFLMDILQLRMWVEYVLYIRIWYSKRGQAWSHPRFRSEISFESFFGAMPSLIIQSYVLLTDDRKASLIQWFSIMWTCLSAFVSLLHYFKYLKVNRPTYVIMCAKALVNSAIRTVLVALLVDYLYGWVWVFVLASYCLGCALYAYGVRYGRSHQRDDPLRFTLCHVAFGHLISTLLLFVSFPFAPNHCVDDWWRGYLLAEFKMQSENIAMAVVILLSHYDSMDPPLFYTAVAFAGSQFIVNFAALCYLHASVRKQLLARDRYSNALVVRLFARVCRHLEDMLEVHQATTDTRKTLAALKPVGLKEMAAAAHTPQSGMGPSMVRRGSTVVVVVPSGVGPGGPSDRTHTPTLPRPESLKVNVSNRTVQKFDFLHRTDKVSPHQNRPLGWGGAGGGEGISPRQRLTESMMTRRRSSAFGGVGSGTGELQLAMMLEAGKMGGAARSSSPLTTKLLHATSSVTECRSSSSPVLKFEDSSPDPAPDLPLMGKNFRSSSCEEPVLVIKPGHKPSSRATVCETAWD